MPDEPTATQTQTVPTGGQPAVQPVPPVVPVVEPTTAEPAPGGAVKTAEQFAEELAEKQRLIDEALDRAARAEHDATLTRTLMEQYGPKKAEEPDKPFFTNEEFLSDPGNALNKALKSIQDGVRSEFERREKIERTERAKESFLEGRELATKEFPDLMKGIESRVQQEVAKGLLEGIIDPDAARNPKVWAATAFSIRMSNESDPFVKNVFGGAKSPSIIPVRPAHTETPTAGAPPRVDVVLSEDDRATARSWGITDEQMLAEKKRSNDEKARLAR